MSPRLRPGRSGADRKSKGKSHSDQRNRVSSPMVYSLTPCSAAPDARFAYARRNQRDSAACTSFATSGINFLTPAALRCTRSHESEGSYQSRMGRPIEV